MSRIGTEKHAKARKPAAKTVKSTLMTLGEEPARRAWRLHRTGKSAIVIFDVPLGATEERLRLIRSGLPAAVIETISTKLGITKSRIYESLNLPRATVDRKIKGGGTLSPEQSERVLGLQRLVGEVTKIVAESGESAGFDAAEWVGQFLETPLPAIGGARPADYMDTMEGQQIILTLLRRAQAGVFA